jgi:putative glutamine transport system substrate-binding protein
MRKFTTFLVAAAALLGLGVSTVSAADAPDIQRIKDRGVLKVGVKVDVPKFGYKDPKTNVFEGLDIDVAKAIAMKILGDGNKIETQAVTAKTRGPLLDNGEVDLVIATFTITPERKEVYNFSDAYYADGIGLLVKKDSGIKNFKGLNGKRVGVAQSATTKKVILEKAKADGINVKISELATYPELKTALDSKRIDCFSVDASILRGYLDDTTELLDDRLSAEEYGVASKKSNVALAKLVNDTVGEMKKNGELDAIAKKWGLK